MSRPGACRFGALLLATLLAAAGCGRGDDKPVASSTTTTRAASAATVPASFGAALPKDGYAVGDSERPGVDLFGFDGTLITRLPSAQLDEVGGGAPSPDVRVALGGRSWVIAGGATALQPAPAQPESRPSSDDGRGTECVVTDAKNGVEYAVCPGDQDTPETIVAIAGSRRTVLARNALDLQAPFKSSGQWRWAFTSADGKWLLAQHSGECEVPHAFFVPTTPGEILPPGDHAESVALGWASTGEAVVSFGKGLCGGAGSPPGIYVVRPRAKPRLVVAYAPDPPSASSTQRIEVWTTP